MAGSQINFDSRTCPGSHISPDPLCVKFTCSPPPHVGSSPGRLFSTRSPPTCKPGGLEIMCERDRLCVSARPAEDWWSVQDVPRPPTSAFWDRLLPPQIEIHAASVRRLLSCVFYGWRLHKASILSVGGCVFFFYNVFRFLLSDLFLWGVLRTSTPSERSGVSVRYSWLTGEPGSVFGKFWSDSGWLLWYVRIIKSLPGELQ